MYALIRDGAIVVLTTARTYDDSDGPTRRWWDFRGGLDADALAAGWAEVVAEPRPADTDTTTHDRTLAVVNGVPTHTWVPRPWTTAELEARRIAGNLARIEQEIDAAIVRLDQLIAAPALPIVGTGTLTTAQLSNALRTLRDADQQTRAGAQDVALILKRTVKLVRGDYNTID